MSFAFFGNMLVVAENGDRVEDCQTVADLYKEVTRKSVEWSGPI